MRGHTSALESQVAAAQRAAAAADEARVLSTADAGRLRSEVAQLTKQRDQLQADLLAEQQELTRLPLTHAKVPESSKAYRHLHSSAQYAIMPSRICVSVTLTGPCWHGSNHQIPSLMP